MARLIQQEWYGHHLGNRPLSYTDLSYHYFLILSRLPQPSTKLARLNRLIQLYVKLLSGLFPKKKKA